MQTRDKEKQSEEASGLIDYFANYGLFLVPVGNLEGWLKGLHVKKKKTQWLIEIFSKMGSDENNTDYLRPSQGDVWEFIEKVAKWIRTQNSVLA